MHLVGHVIREEQRHNVRKIGRSIVCSIFLLPLLLLFPIEGSDWIADPLDSELQRLASAICALVVQQSITVKASSDVPDVVDWFDLLVLFISQEKNWKITLDHRVYNLGDNSDPAPFRHTWEICPTSTAIEAGDAMEVGATVETGDVVEAGDTMEIDQVTEAEKVVEAEEAVEVPRKRPWEL